MSDGAGHHRGVSKQDYATPPAFLDAVEGRFGPIGWDLAATVGTNVSARKGYGREDYFGPDHVNDARRDALVTDWDISGLLWLNPPFDNIAPWAEKCAQCRNRSDFLLFLVPASVGSNWFADHVHGKALVLFLPPRLSFDGKNPYPKDCILAVYGYGISGYDTWRWKNA